MAADAAVVVALQFRVAVVVVAAAL